MLRPLPQINLFRPLTRAWSSSCSQPTHRWLLPEGHDTGVRVYNCVAREKVPLVVRNRHLATFYTCGPTVYDDTHLGHASCYVKLDIVQRLLRDYFGIGLVTCMNITDIDDKIIRRGQESGRDWKDVAQENELKFWRSLQQLGVQRPHFAVRVTEHMPEIRQFVQKLLAQGNAYQGRDASIYFDCSTLPGHGKLSKQQQDEEEAEEEKEPGIVKRTSRDFVLWKATSGGPVFEAEFGAGRPGWHIECSAMASKVFGDRIDFHGGGWDLLFPHHENEETQSCAFHGTGQWVNYWMHTGQLRLQGATQKMSKSLKNTISVEEFLQKSSANDFRMFCLLSNYRSNTEFSEAGILTARRVLDKFWNFTQDLRLHLSGQRVWRVVARGGADIQAKLTETIRLYDEALRDDFDTARSIKVLQDFMGYLYKQQQQQVHEIDSVTLDSGIVRLAEEFFSRQLRIWGLDSAGGGEGQQVQDTDCGSSDGLVIDAVLEIRNELRRRGKSSNDKSLYFLADFIRKRLSEAGVQIKDQDKGTTTWSRRRD